ncbi:MAG TPA: N-acetyl-gamma-glutamyl-phosphate reductase [Methanomicrobia archaeon]|nr:N-acetyl-gamma-glutamyl-phosphate reductase [Methanomicrobia archaeon]
MTDDTTTPISASVIGATGYLGGEVIRLLANHPHVEIASLTSQSQAGRPIHSFHPTLRGVVNKEFEDYTAERIAEVSDVVFCAVPHGAAFTVVKELFDIRPDLTIIDLSADFRLRDVDTYQSWYNTEHTASSLIKEAIYGLCEHYREDIAQARLIANPGCYPTSALLALIPLVKRGLISTDGIVVDSKSALSGAGRKLSHQSHYAHCNESIMAYAVGAHRHTPEIEQEVGLRAHGDVALNFTPHLTPMNRGILSTIYASAADGTSTAALRQAYDEDYGDEYFVRFLEEGAWPETRSVRATNFCDLQCTLDPRTGRVIIVSAIDNLVKGGAGQAIQNLNIIKGFDERAGLDASGVYI